MRTRRLNLLVCLLLIASLLASGTVFAAEPGLFSRVKAKVQAKFEEAKTKDFWVKTIYSRSLSLVAGKAAGLLGFGLAGVIGFAIGGPVGGGIGALLGYRIASAVAKAFARPLGEELARQKLSGQKLSLKKAWEPLSGKVLTAEGLGTAAGNIVGEVVGVTAGVALLGGLGPMALPFLGVVSGGWLGQKVGEKVGRWLGGKVGKKAGLALVAKEPTAAVATGPALPGSASGADPTAARAAYEKAYQAYVSALGKDSVDPATRDRLFREYQTAREAWQPASR
ncbi:MAG: hypothetical protein GX442_01115 [Candidatus Riflebacteria bacterium]|nr:hypothetical protein [Candidatus Riflebacteria bacterium]